MENKEKIIELGKNFWKSIFLGISIVLLSLVTYGVSIPILIINFLYIFILCMVATNVVDGIYYLRKKRREVKKSG